MYLIRYRRADYRRFGDYIGIRNFYVVSRNNFATKHKAVEYLRERGFVDFSERSGRKGHKLPHCMVLKMGGNYVQARVLKEEDCALNELFLCFRDDKKFQEGLKNRNQHLLGKDSIVLVEK